MMTRSWPNGRRASCGACETATGSVPGSHWMTALRGGPGAGHVPAPRLCRRHSPVSAAPSATSSAGRTTTIGCGTATFAREALERSEELKRDWNRQVDRAAEEGVHVIYTDGYDRLHKELDSVSKNMLLDRGVKSEISAVLAQARQGRVKPQLLRQLPRTHGGPDGPPRGAGGQGGRAGRGGSRP